MTMTVITVTNQVELDAACQRQKSDPCVRIVIRSGSSRVVVWDSSRVEAWESSRVVARGSSQVVARDSSRVEALGSSQVEAWESSRVVARDSSQVVARGSSRVVARDSSRVEAWGSSQVEAWESSRVEAWESSRVVASARVAIHRMNSRARINGGVVIDCTDPITSAGDALREWNISQKRGRVTLYKAVNDDLRSGYDFHYPIGKTVEAADWSPEVCCGKGLHLSPTPHAARGYMPSATRFLECTVAVRDLALCSQDVFPDKIKARRVRVVREVDVWGDPVEVVA